ncbi:MAG TPA: hypothetical protein PLP23_08815 [Panacibacter sp.]|nr:hypothetical protein [Panacibacter sp.]
MVLTDIKYLCFFLLSINACIFSTNRNNPEKKLINNKMVNQTLSSSNEDCEVKISLLIKDEFMAECTINIKNKTSGNLYFFNRIYTEYSDEGFFEVDKNLFYAYIDGHNRLLMAKAIIPVPEGLQVEKEIYPCCTKILAGTAFEEKLAIKLPIKLYGPYETQKDKIEKDYSASFRLGYFVGHDQTESMEIKVHTKEGEELIYFDPFDYKFQKIIQVGEFNPLPVSK